ncbi:hypothetical protein AURANDRAFT_67113 [Aureococcus anophagefferens]|uniref:Uncharacterized protein n=1 Tax=Aureococcus anophagefferens TaxID=44056 RepID=F0YK02_AURAN|nr:hypothetical protein AURANDRAFT_67113 [Aureococcus anophagefferens]EGB04597.1 hypothetical protein AURANDRAFT_67113 [Aureococcus anophagefferens]|eukprot:XP_009040703.1 hypothetical protein AURANDRAFT_67113 [Aureococcus anophagefferens]
MRAAIVALAALARSAGGEAPTPAPTPAPPTAPPTAPAPTTFYRPSASPTEEFCAPRRIRDRLETCDDAARYGADCHALEVHLGVNCGDCACVADTTGLGTGWTFGAYVDDACEDPLRHWDGDVVVADLPSGARTFANDACAAATWSGTAISFRGRCASGSVYFRMFEGEGCNASRPYDDRDRVWLAASPFPLSDGSFCAPVEHVGSAWDNPREYLLFSCFDTPVPTAAPTFAPTHSFPPTEAPTVSPTVSPARDRRADAGSYPGALAAPEYATHARTVAAAQRNADVRADHLAGPDALPDSRADVRAHHRRSHGVSHSRADVRADAHAVDIAVSDDLRAIAGTLVPSDDDGAADGRPDVASDPFAVDEPAALLEQTEL